jgi:hypothetical protein
MTVAAMQMAKKVWAHLSQWVEMRRSSLMSVLDQMTVAHFKFKNKKIYSPRIKTRNSTLQVTVVLTMRSPFTKRISILC